MILFYYPLTVLTDYHLTRVAKEIMEGLRNIQKTLTSSGLNDLWKSLLLGNIQKTLTSSGLNDLWKSLLLGNIQKTLTSSGLNYGRAYLEKYSKDSY